MLKVTFCKHQNDLKILIDYQTLSVAKKKTGTTKAKSFSSLSSQHYKKVIGQKTRLLSKIFNKNHKNSTEVKSFHVF